MDRKIVAAAVIEKDGRILIALRKKGGRMGHRWEFPGGKVERGEGPEDCLRRELLEELGIEAEIGEFLMSSRFEYPHLKIELRAYRVRSISGELKLTDHDEVRWVLSRELGGYDFTEADIPVVQALMRGPEGRRKGGGVMDIFTAIKERRSCRRFMPGPVGEDIVERILEAGSWAPSPANNQPWEFVVITSPVVKEDLFLEAERCKASLFEKSGWKWLDSYRVNFVKDAPLIIAVIGDPKKSGADLFLEGAGRGLGYQHACAAAIQNMLLAAHALGLGSLWFTVFEVAPMQKILKTGPEKVPVALLCIGKPAAEGFSSKRKDFREKTTYLK